MEIGKTGNNAIKVAAALTGIAVGISTTFNVATAKAPQGSFGAQVQWTSSRILGPKVATGFWNGTGLKIGSGANLPAAGINPLGPINGTTLGGIITLIADYVVEEFIDGRYGYKYAHPFVKALGMGLTAGGIVGGLLDPANSNGTVNTSMGEVGYTLAPGAIAQGATTLRGAI